MPVPSADHTAPSQLATKFALVPPAVEKSPPANRSPFGSVVRARTGASMPVLSVDHAAPSHRAIRFALTPPAVVNHPPATRSPFDSVVRVTTMLMPVPSGDHE